MRKTPTSWEGQLVKAQFKCEDDIGESEYCVIIKYAGTFEGESCLSLKRVGGGGGRGGRRAAVVRHSLKTISNYLISDEIPLTLFSKIW